MRECLAAGTLQKEIERRHAAFDIDVVDHQRIALVFQHRRRERTQLLQHFLREARLRQCNLRVLPHVDHAPDTIVLLDQKIFLLDAGATDLLRISRMIADHLEHVGIGGQREHDHHQTLGAGREHELVGRVTQVMQQVAIEECLALLL